jgi:hypothetical protein
MIRLGSKVKDVVSGFEGITTGRAEYLTGCAQYLVAPPGLDKDGKLKDAHWFDEGKLVVTAAPTKAIAAVGNQPQVANGGPQRDAPTGRR